MRFLLALAVLLPSSLFAAGTTATGACPPGFVEVANPHNASGRVTILEGTSSTAALCMPAPPLRAAEPTPRPTPFPARDFREPMPAEASELRLVSLNPPSPTALAQLTSTRVIVRTYDDFDRVKSELVPLEDGTSAQIRYTYYKDGLRKTMTDAFNRVTFYEYDGKARLERVTANQGQPDQHVTSYTYWPDDLLKSISAPNGVVTTYAYDRADRVTFIDVRRDEVALLSYEYTYDKNGNRLSQIETNGGVPELTTYTYDARDRLETVTYPSGTSVVYAYDEVGNRTGETERSAAGTIVSNKIAVFDAINRLSSVTDSENPANDATFTYDANGNLLTKTTAAGTETYDYDPRDLMVEARSGPAILARYAYDAFGRRYLKVSSEGAFTSVVRQYLYDETSLLHELDDADLEVAKYEYTGDRLASLARRDEPRRFYHQDGLGSVVALSDSAGAVVARYHLDAWGRYRAPSELDASANRFGFTGYLFDQETELYYAKARFYDPEYGRFTSQDSVLGDISEPPSLHRYFYGYANPLRYVDPTGHQAAPSNAASRETIAMWEELYPPPAESSPPPEPVVVVESRCSGFLCPVVEPVINGGSWAFDNTFGRLTRWWDRKGVAAGEVVRDKILTAEPSDRVMSNRRSMTEGLPPAILAADQGTQQLGHRAQETAADIGEEATRAAVRELGVAVTTAGASRTLAKTAEAAEAVAAEARLASKTTDAPRHLGNRRLPQGENPWIKYQEHVTARRYEELWQVGAEKVAADARRGGYTVEAKWTGRNDAAWKSSPYNPTSRFYDEPGILDQARRLIELDRTTGGRGVRYGVSNPGAQRHFDSLFRDHFPGENITVWHVPGTGMGK